MAEYNYKGYVAEVYEDVLADEWFTFLPEPPRYKVYLRSEFNKYTSNSCDESQARVIRAMYIKWFENSVDKHLEGRW